MLNKFTKNPSYVLLVTQLFSTISYAILYSTLVLFMTQRLHLPEIKANELMGLFIAFNYGLHLMGGYVGGRLLSYRALFIIGMLIQIGACIILSCQTISSLYWGLALFLAGAGLNIPCINMMLTQQFKPENLERETSFIWNYAGMNAGFFIGFTLAGFFQLHQGFQTLFLLAALTNLIAFAIILHGWRAVKDKTTPLASLAKESAKQARNRRVYGLVLIALLIMALQYLLQQANKTNALILSIGAGLFILFFILALKEKEQIARRRLYAYIILSCGGFVFWSLFQLAPMALTLFIQHNVDRQIGSITIATQWVANINTIVILLGGFFLPPLFKKIRRKHDFGLPLQFSLSLFFIGLGLIILPLGIYFGEVNGLMKFGWIASSYFIQALGELFIGPIGYAMIGLLATEKLQGLMMGAWMLLTGGSSGVIASLLSNYAIKDAKTVNPIITNPGYSHLFLVIGIFALITSGILLSLLPFLRKLIDIKRAA